MSVGSDAEIVNLISDVIGLVSKEGVITVEDNNTMFNEHLVVHEVHLALFVAGNNIQTCTMKYWQALFVVASLQSIISGLDTVVKTCGELLIITEVDMSEVLAALVIQKSREQVSDYTNNCNASLQPSGRVGI